MMFLRMHLHTDDSTCRITVLHRHQNGHVTSAQPLVTRYLFLIQGSINKSNYFRNDIQVCYTEKCAKLLNWKKKWRMMCLQACQKLTEPINSSALNHEQTFNYYSWNHFRDSLIPLAQFTRADSWNSYTGSTSSSRARAFSQKEPKLKSNAGWCAKDRRLMFPIGNNK